MLNRRTRIINREFICKGEPDHHTFRCSVRVEVTDDGQSVEQSAWFMRFGSAAWSKLPICACGSLAEESATYDPRSAAIPSAERVQVWLSADGKRVAIPMKTDRPMPERYVVSGYRLIEAQSMRDIERIQGIRAAQTDNQTVSEMNYSPANRQWHLDKPYDPDSMTED